jgi:transcriptional regulator with XRE-family HTH domain
MLHRLGDTIRQRRLAKGLTQAQLGAQLGVSQVAVSEWERDVTTPSKLKELCTVLDMPHDEILAAMIADDDVEKAIWAQSRLTRDSRQALVTIYQQLLAGSTGVHRLASD